MLVYGVCIQFQKTRAKVADKRVRKRQRYKRLRLLTNLLPTLQGKGAPHACEAAHRPLVNDINLEKSIRIIKFPVYMYNGRGESNVKNWAPGARLISIRSWWAQVNVCWPGGVGDKLRPRPSCQPTLISLALSLSLSLSLLPPHSFLLL